MLTRNSAQREKNGIKLARRCLFFGLFLLGCALLQVTLLSRWRLFGIVPDLMVCAVISIGFFCGTHEGAICGISGGFLIEALGSFGVSVLPVFYLLCGYVVGHYARAIYPKRFAAYGIYAFLAILLRSGASLALAAVTYENIQLPRMLLRTVLPEFLLTLLLAALVYLPMRVICRALQKK